MARTPLPYPPSPTDFPDALTDPGRESAAEIVAVLAGLFLFLFAYVGLILGSLALIVVMALYLSRLPFPFLWTLASVVAAVFAFLLIKGLFNRLTPDRDMNVEIEEDDQPVFFAFLRRLTDEIGAPMPHRVFVTPEVNASMMQRLSLVNLVVPPKKELIVGLGLVNALNLSEFKAVMGHEFGHFSQKTSRMHAYVGIANGVILNLIQGEDWLDRLIREARLYSRSTADVSALFAAAFAVGAGAMVLAFRKGLYGLYCLLNMAANSLSRKNEFHADRIAVSVAGSNAIVHSLYRLSFALESLNEAARQLEVASQHKLYTRDLFFHQTTAADYLRRVRKKPRLGLPPELKGPNDGRKVRVFREDDEEEDEEIPPMWATHPKNYDREENAKAIFVPAPIDERSPWVLFRDADALKESVTRRFYRVAFKVKKGAELVPADEVQGFLDEEHAEITYDPKYHGCYDERPIFPGDVDELNQLVDDEPWDAERIRRVHERLYRDLGRRVEDLADVRKGMRDIHRRSFGRPRGRDRTRLFELEDRFKELSEWFGSFDRRVFLVHAHMAKQLRGRHLQELSHRYRFHLGLQDIHRQIAGAQEQVEDVLEGLNHYGEELPEGFFEELMDTFRAGRQVLRDCLAEGREMRTPQMANIPEGTRLDKLVFEGELVREPPETFVRGTWVTKFVQQLGRMRHRVNRMDFKSLGAILQMQDRLAAEWFARPPAPVEEPLPELIVVEDEKEAPPEPDPWSVRPD